jgi:hypothetical protein
LSAGLTSSKFRHLSRLADPDVKNRCKAPTSKPQSHDYPRKVGKTISSTVAAQNLKPHHIPEGVSIA